MRSNAILVLLVFAALLGAGCGGGAETGDGGTGDGGDTVAASTVTAAEISAPERVAVDAPTPVAEATKAARPAPASGARLQVVDSEFGRVVADRHGEALYLFDREHGRKSQCYGACARVWPPLLTKRKPVAAGVDQDLLGTTRRADGRLQVTYAGHPLYYYIGDSPGTILCHDVVEFGGTWLVVGPDGRPAA